MKRLAVFLILMMAACVPVDDTATEPVNEPVIEQHKSVESPAKTKPSEVKEEDKEADNEEDWDCRSTNNEVINVWKLRYKCDELI